MLGAELSSGADLDTSMVSLSALRENLDYSLAIFADVVLNPVFPPNELERLRAQYLALVRQEKTRPTSMALRVLPKLIYGEGHAYAQPLTGSGTEESIRANSGNSPLGNPAGSGGFERSAPAGAAVIAGCG